MFVMVGKSQIVDAFRGAVATKRPRAAVEILAEIIQRMGWDGTATFSRRELAEKLGLNVATVSCVLTDLQRKGVVVDRKSDGRRLTVSVNPRLATRLRAADRARAQAGAPAIQPAA